MLLKVHRVEERHRGGDTPTVLQVRCWIRSLILANSKQYEDVSIHGVDSRGAKVCRGLCPV